MTTKNKSRQFLYVWILATFFVLVVHIKLIPYAHDDAYIYVRIADHLAQNGVPYYNVGEAVQASSSTAWPILLAIIFKFTSANVLVIAVLNTLFTMTAAQVYFRVLCELIPRKLTLGVYELFLILFVSLTLLPSTGLMESSFAVLILGIGLLLLLRRKPYSFIMLGAAVFCRLEFIVFLGLFGLFAVFRQKLSIKKVTLYTIAGMLPFALFDLLFFRSIIPNTIAAKATVYRLSLDDAINFVVTLAVPDSVMLIPFKDARTWIAGLIGLAILLALFNVVRNFRRVTDADVIVFLLWIGGGSLACAYIAAHAMTFQWYVPLFTIPILIATYRSMMLPSSGIWMVRFVAFATLPLTIALAQTIVASTGTPEASQNFVTGARVRSYLQVSEELNRTFPNATFLTSEIGGLGYGFKGKIWDGMGLASPAALAYHPMPVPQQRSSGLLGAIPVQFIKDNDPDIVVSYDIFAEAFLRSPLKSNYWRVRLPVYLDDDMTVSPLKTLWGSTSLNIFIKKGSIHPIAQFGDTLELADPTLSAQTVTHDQTLQVSTFWHTIKPSSPVYMASAVLMDSNGQTVDRQDQRLISKYMPFSAWGNDGLYLTTHTIQIPTSLAPGKYQIAMGLYSNVTKELIPLSGQSQDYFPVATVTVTG